MKPKKDMPDFDRAVKIMYSTLTATLVLAIALALFAFWVSRVPK